MNIERLNFEDDDSAQLMSIHRWADPDISGNGTGLQPHVEIVRRTVVGGEATTVVEALAIALSGQPGVQVVARASRESDLLNLVVSECPDAVVIYSPQLNVETIDMAGRLKTHDADLRVVLLAAEPSFHLLAQAAAVGVAAHLSVNAGLHELAEAIRLDSSGTMLLDPSSLLVASPRSHADDASVDPAALTRRELEVLAMLADGYSPPAIATHLVISIYTARGHVKNVLRKLGAHSQLEAVAAARRMGLLRAAGDIPDTAHRLCRPNATAGIGGPGWGALDRSGRTYR